jgi:hypothetical protein
MAHGLTTGMKAALAIEAVIALLFVIFGLGESYRNSVGRGPGLSDILAAGFPLVLVIVAAFLASAAVRRGNNGQAWAVALAPFPVAIVVAMVLGAV